MKYDESIRDRILLQVVQIDEFRTDRKDEAHHVALLIDEGLVDGKIVTDEESGAVKSAVIYRLKRKGYEKLSQILEPSPACDFSSERKDLNDVIRESEKAHDKLIATLSCGGIGLFFTFLGLVSDLLKCNPLTWWEYFWSGVALLSWVVSLVSLLVSHFRSIAMVETQIDKIDKRTYDPEESNASRSIMKMQNIFNAGLTIIGILAFCVFVALVFANR